MAIPQGSKLKVTKFKANTKNKALNTDKVTIYAGAELMEDHIAGLPLSAEHPFQVAQDSDGNPLIVSIGTQNQLYILYRDPNNRSGWSQAHISKRFEEQQIHAFNLAQDPESGSLFFTIAVSNPKNEKISDLYITNLLSNKVGAIDWQKFHHQWIHRANDTKNKDWKVNKIQLLTPYEVDDDLPQVLITTEAPDQKKASYFIINTDTEEKNNLWDEFAPDADDTKAIASVFGRISDVGNSGLYLAYSNNGKPFLEFKPFPILLPNGNHANLPIRELQAPEGIKTLAIGAGDGDTTELFVGGDGLFVFSPDNQAKNAEAQEIGKGVFTTIDEIMVRQDESGTALWALDRTQKLFYTFRKAGSQDWSMPIPLHQGIGQIGAFVGATRNQQRNTNQLYVLDNQSHLIYMWQDPQSTIWNEKKIPLSSTKHHISVHSYAVTFCLLDQRNRPFNPNDIPLSISASEWTYITINGESHILDQTPTEGFKLNLQGKLHFTVHATTSHAPEFTIHSDVLESRVHIDPSGHIHNQLANMSKHDWLHTSFTQGKHKSAKVLKGDKRDEHANTLAASLSQLHSIGNNSRTKRLQKQYGSTVNITPISSNVFLTKDGKHKRTVQNDTPAVTSFGMHFGNEHPTYHHGEEGESALLDKLDIQPRALHIAIKKQNNAPQERGIWDGIDKAHKVVGGDLIHSLLKGLKKALGFIAKFVEGAWHFFVKVGTTIFHFVLESIALVRKVVSWVLKEVADVFLYGLLSLFGWIMDWDEIRKTQAVVMNFVNQTFNWGEAKLDKLAHTVHDDFEKAKDFIRKLMPDATAGQHPQQTDDKAQSNSKIANILEFFIGNPVSNWILQKIEDLIFSDGDLEKPKPKGLDSALELFDQDVMQPVFNGMTDDIFETMHDIKRAHKENKSFKEIIELMAVDLALSIVDIIEQLVVGLIKFFRDVLKLAQEYLNADLDLPLVGSLYKEKIGGNFSILAGFCMFCSFAANALIKLTTGKYPFQDGTQGLDTISHETLFAALQAPVPKNRGLKRLAKRENHDKDDQVAHNYAKIGGVIFLFADVAFRILAITRSALNIAGKFNRVGLGLMNGLIFTLQALKISCSFPVNNPKPAQYATWGVLVGQTVLKDLIAIIIQKPNVKIGAANENTNLLAGKAKKLPARAIWLGVIGYLAAGTRFITTTITLVQEIKEKTDPEQWYIERYSQQLYTVLFGVSTATATFLKDPESKGVALVLAAAFGFGADASIAARTIYHLTTKQDHNSL